MTKSNTPDSAATEAENGSTAPKEREERHPAAQDLDIDALLGKTRFIVPPELMDNAALVKIAYAAQACLEQWAQGRGVPPRLTSEERALRDALGLDMEVFGDARS